MPRLSIDELKSLVEGAQSPCVSLYMPVQIAGPEVRQNPIRFKNLIKEAEARLDAMEMRHTEAVEFLKQAHELDTSEFWEENQDQGLAIFISPTTFRYYRLPMEFEELVVVSDQFHFKPLLHLINNDRQFYVLALSQDNVRFFEGTRYSVKEVEVPNMPTNLDDALQYDETAKEGQNRIATSRGGTSNPMTQPGEFHGQGSPDQDEHQKAILQFFHLINDALHEKLRNQKAPLVLAGVEYLFAIYREANSYQHLLEEGIHVNVDIVKPEELQDQAVPIVEPLFHQAENEAIERYYELAGNAPNQVSNDIKEIIPAAYFHRVDALFVPVQQEIWGDFDPDTMNVDLHPEPEPNDEDMLDFAAIHTILNGGKVYTVEPEQVPNKAPAAAIFRY